MAATLPGNQQVEYTEQGTDRLLEQFEKLCKKWQTYENQIIKRSAAEKNLLKKAEVSRDLLNRAVGGDKSRLAEVFGGDCMRFHRFRFIIETVNFSEAHKEDQRWAHLQTEMDIVEEILKQNGLFKPYVLAGAPTSMKYQAFPTKVNFDVDVDFEVSVEGTDLASLTFSVSPALPADLVLNRRTGKVTGKVRDGVEVPTRTYTVAASNLKGSAAYKLTFGIAPRAPGGFRYKIESPTVGQEISWPAEITGGGMSSNWTVEPALPAGLRLDPKTGEIAGTPKLMLEKETSYKVKGSNSQGSAETTFSFSVDDPAPESISYPDANGSELQLMSMVRLLPELKIKDKQVESVRNSANSKLASALGMPGQWGGPSLASGGGGHFQRTLLQGAKPNIKFAVKPALPEGLLLIPTTGTISGRPSKECQGGRAIVTHLLSDFLLFLFLGVTCCLSVGAAACQLC